MLCVLCSILVAAPLLSRAQATAPNEKVPVMEGGAGPCSIELTVLGADGKPVYAATVKVYIKYGFGGIRRLDLEAGTNSDGKVRFAGLPARVQRPPLEFHRSKDEFTGIATFDPSTECQAKRQIALEKPKAQTAINGLSLNLLLWSLVFSTDSIPLKFHLKWQRDEDHTMRRSSTLFCEHCECCGDDHYAPESRRDSRGVTQAAWRGEAPMQRPRQLAARGVSLHS